MLPFLQRCQLVVRPSATKGYGVYADQDILTGEIIEQCHVLFCRQNLDELRDYIFYSSKADLIALGYGSIYNHSTKPNAQYYYRPDKSILEFKALQYIKKGEEIFVFYGLNWFPSRKTSPKERWIVRFGQHYLRIARFSLLTIFLILTIICLKQFSL